MLATWVGCYLPSQWVSLFVSPSTIAITPGCIRNLPVLKPTREYKWKGTAIYQEYGNNTLAGSP